MFPESGSLNSKTAAATARLQYRYLHLAKLSHRNHILLLAMFSTKLNHLAHRVSCVAALSAQSSSSATATAHRSTQCAAARARRPHQRRHSSSKASCPPENSASGGKPAPATKEPAAELSTPETSQKNTKRITRTKRSRPAAVAKPEDQFAGLPAVPGTQHINYAGTILCVFELLIRSTDQLQI